MNTVTAIEPRIADLRVTDSEITAFLVDGRNVSVPLAWSWRLSDNPCPAKPLGTHWRWHRCALARR